MVLPLAIGADYTLWISHTVSVPILWLEVITVFCRA